jgi:hypothetical protein
MRISQEFAMKLLVIAFFLCVSASQAQTESVSAKPPKLPGKVARGADGKPDLSGIWQHIGVTLFGETGELRPGQGSSKTTWGPPVGPAPYKPELQAKVEHLGSDDRLSPTVQCKMAGVPRATGGVTPLEILQTPKKVAIMYESNHMFRIIPVDKPHPAEVYPSYMGDSVGRWEGDTFVVDVTGFNDMTWLPGPGHFHSEKLHVVERYTLQPDNTLYYEAVMEDPEVLTRPWANRIILRHPPRDERIMEDECNENNQDLEHIQPGKFTQR